MSNQDGQSAAGELSQRKSEKRYRLYGKAHRMTLALLWQSQGNQCYYRFQGCLNKPEAIAHKDHDSRNWEPGNLAASCLHCNAVISNQAKRKVRSVLMRVSEIGRDEVGPGDNLVRLSDRLIAAADQWLWEHLGPGSIHKYLPVKHCAREISNDCGMSVIVARRYIVDGPLSATNNRWDVQEIAMDPRKPNAKTLCVRWKGRALEDELEDTLYRAGRKQFEAALSEKES